MYSAISDGMPAKNMELTFTSTRCEIAESESPSDRPTGEWLAGLVSCLCLLHHSLNLTLLN